MSLLISAASSTPRDFSDADNAALDELSFSLSEGNWREHVREIFFPKTVEDELDLPVQDALDAAQEFISYHSGKILDTYHAWHVEVARKLIKLCEKAIILNCDRISVAG